jgi:2-amino-4-hydroxy-6-hydroxymethyldihydropteridine diphosphokinase
MIDVFLLLGSNLGNRENFLFEASKAIAAGVGPITKKSAIYLSGAWGKTDQADFLNQVLQVSTLLTAQQVLKTILNIELDLGRERNERWGPRTIDIDILFYGEDVINESQLTIPHPGIHLRKFTLMPLAEIAPQLIHPVFNKSIQQLDEENIDTSVKRYNFF